MNTKSVLIATLLAAASSAAFAADVAPAAPAVEKIEAVQVAQANTGMRNVAPSARAGSNAVTASCANTYNEATSMIVCSNSDSRTRAQVREETRAWLNSPEGKASRATYFGGAL
jgi:opacity protein-like surface antigen